MKNRIPYVDYTEEENKLWGYLISQLRPLHFRNYCQEYLEGYEDFEKVGLFNTKGIPQLEDLNAFLKEKANWRIKPVNGILSAREFFNCLAFRTFCSTQYIRHPSVPGYTPEPDIMHEFLGHLPNFLNPKICELSQRLGILSLGATDEEITKISTIYWFTIEFGLCMESNSYKIFGAGPAGSIDEINEIEKKIKRNDPQILRKMDLGHNDFNSNIVLQDLQPYYYVAKSFTDILDQLDAYSKVMINKPFNLKYDSSTNSFQTDRPLKMVKGCLNNQEPVRCSKEQVKAPT